jgi:DNA-binding IclR family transcriptional regulator
MQDDPIARSLDRAAPPTSHRHQLKRWLLLELVSYPPADGDELEDLTRKLQEPRREVQAAVHELVSDGLAERDGDRVRASTAAWKFDALWPARL